MEWEAGSRNEALNHAVEWAARAQPLAELLRRADEGDVEALGQVSGKGERLNAAIRMANMWAGIAGLLPNRDEPPATSDEPERVVDDEGDIWTKRANGRYSMGNDTGFRTFEYLAEEYGPLTVIEAEDEPS